MNCFSSHNILFFRKTTLYAYFVEDNRKNEQSVSFIKSLNSDKAPYQIVLQYGKVINSLTTVIYQGAFSHSMSTGEPQSDGSLKRNAFTLYAVIAILITAICWVPTSIIASANGYILPSHFTFAELVQNGFNDSLHLVTVLIFSIGAYGPFIAALLAISLEVGRDGI